MGRATAEAFAGCAGLQLVLAYTTSGEVLPAAARCEQAPLEQLLNDDKGVHLGSSKCDLLIVAWLPWDFQVLPRAAVRAAVRATERGALGLGLGLGELRTPVEPQRCEAVAFRYTELGHRGPVVWQRRLVREAAESWAQALASRAFATAAAEALLLGALASRDRVSTQPQPAQLVRPGELYGLARRGAR